MRRLVMILPVLVCCTAWVSLFAQAPSAAPANAPVCLTKSTQGKLGGNHAFTIIAPPSRVPEMQSRGFVVEACGSKQAALPMLKQRMCRLAQQSNSDSAGSFLSVYSVTPVELCQMATEASAL